MAVYAVVCWGGPLDGLLITRRSAPPLVGFVTAAGRIYRAPHRNAVPYRFEWRRRLAHRVGGEQLYEVRLHYAEHDLVCARCGCLNLIETRDADDGCQLCGGPLRMVGA